MRRLLLALVLCAALVGIGVAPASAAGQVAAHGKFAVEITGDPALQPLASDRCLLTLPVTLTFRGTLKGMAPGTLQAAVDASCGDVLTVPPGTFADVFVFTGTFTGKVAGERTSAGLVYSGVTRPGGDVRGLIALDGGATGLLTVDAEAGTGGSYSGAVTR